MTESKLTEDFWRNCEIANFSKEATVLFFHLLSLHRQSKSETVYLHPASLLCKIVGFNAAAVVAASEELQNRGYIEFTPAEGARTSGMYRFKNLDAIKPRTPKTPDSKTSDSKK